VRRPALPFRAPAVGLLALGLVLGAGCSSSGSSTSSTSSTLAPEDILVPNAKVTSGLASLGRLVATAATQAGTSADAAKATVDQSWDQWLAIEGRVKKNDTGAYLEFEDALSDMRIGADEGNAAKVKKGATAVAALSTAYLAKFPA
jgi:hypothetical protein